MTAAAPEFFFCRVRAAARISSLPPHGAFPISPPVHHSRRHRRRGAAPGPRPSARVPGGDGITRWVKVTAFGRSRARRSEEHTSELQSHLNLPCRLLLEKNNNILPALHHHSTHH